MGCFNEENCKCPALALCPGLFKVLPFPGNLLSSKAVNTAISLPILTPVTSLLICTERDGMYPWWNWISCPVVLGFFKWRIKKTHPKQNCLLPRGAESFCWEDNTSTVSLSPLAVVTVGLVGPWDHLARHKKATKPGCGVAVCHRQLRGGWEGNAVLAGDCRHTLRAAQRCWMGVDDYIMWSLSKAIPANTALLMSEQRVLVLLWAGFQWNCNWENKGLQTISYILKTTLQQNCLW